MKREWEEPQTELQYPPPACCLLEHSDNDTAYTKKIRSVFASVRMYAGVYSVLY